jgi:YD repeat-containing protein
VDYDSQGRVQHAWELDNPGAPRLDFAWQGKQLMQITGHAATGGAVVYSRTLQYSGDKLTGETITSNSGKSSHIKYKYDKQDRIIEADCEDDHALDGRSRQVEFVVDAAKGGKR